MGQALSRLLFISLLEASPLENQEGEMHGTNTRAKFSLCDISAVLEAFWCLLCHQWFF